MEEKNLNSTYKEVQEKQGKKRAKRKTQKRNRYMLILVGLILVAVSLYSMYGFLMTFLADIAIVEAVTYEDVLPCRAWSFQQESVVYTDLPGTVVPMINSGERISKGVEIGRFNYQNTLSLYEEGNRRLYSPIAGILSYEVDGLEFVNMRRDYQILTVELIEGKLEELGFLTEETSGGFTDILQDKLEQESGGAPEQEPAVQEPEITPPKAVAAGEGIFKVTDNLSDCYIYLRTQEPSITPFEAGEIIDLRLRTEEGLLTGKAEVIECSPLGLPASLPPSGEEADGPEASSAAGDQSGGKEQTAAENGVSQTPEGESLDPSVGKSDQPADWINGGAPTAAMILSGSLKGPEEGGPEDTTLSEKPQSQAEGWGILVRLTSGLEPVRHSREQELDIVIGSEEVGEVNSGALVEKNGRTGVFLYQKNTVVWTPVEVLEQRDDRTVIKGVDAGETVITRPWLVRDGMKLQLGS